VRDGDKQERPVEFGDDGGCFGCSARNPHGLQLRFRQRGDVIVADHVIAERFHGAPGIAHGGIIATLLDEVSCAAAAVARDTHVVTGELSVRYRRPCPVEVPLTLSARITGEQTRYLVIAAEVRRDDEVLAHSTGKFFLTANPRTVP
jgi:acyl-coenzyme A thioesterase PaaI-like protein